MTVFLLKISYVIVMFLKYYSLVFRTAARFDCASVYKMRVFLLKELVNDLTSRLDLSTAFMLVDMPWFQGVSVEETNFDDPRIVDVCNLENVVQHVNGNVCQAWKEVKTVNDSFIFL